MSSISFSYFLWGLEVEKLLTSTPNSFEQNSSSLGPAPGALEWVQWAGQMERNRRFTSGAEGMDELMRLKEIRTGVDRLGDGSMWPVKPGRVPEGLARGSEGN